MKKTTALLAVLSLGSAIPLTQAEVSVEFFYESLEPHGEWLEVADYGYVWHPRDADENWRPYTVGQWAHTEAGWTWVSEEPHGWATHHYGRWVNVEPAGWVWVPGTEWGPAWVSWRRSERHVGWAPLPPEASFRVNFTIGDWADSYYDIGPANYSFVEVRHLGAPRLRTVVLPPRENITIIRETRNITNITYRNNIVINEGPRYDEVVRVSAEPIRRLRLDRRTDITDARAVASYRTRVEGDSLSIAAPTVVYNTNVAPKRVARKVANAQVNRGWRAEGIAPQEAERMRATVRQEAKAPANLPAQPKFEREERSSTATSTNTETTAPGTATPRTGRAGSTAPAAPGARSTAEGTEPAKPASPTATTPGESAPSTKPEKTPATPGTDVPGRPGRTNQPGARTADSQTPPATPGSAPKNESERPDASTKPDATPARPGRTSPPDVSADDKPGRPARESAPEAVDRPGKAPARSTTPGASETPGSPDPAKTGRPEAPGKSNPVNRPESPGRSDRPGRPTTPDEPETTRPGSNRPDASPAPARTERPTRPDASANPAKTDRPDKPERAESPNRSARPASPTQPEAAPRAESPSRPDRDDKPAKPNSAAERPTTAPERAKPDRSQPERPPTARAEKPERPAAAERSAQPKPERPTTARAEAKAPASGTAETAEDREKKKKN